MGAPFSYHNSDEIYFSSLNVIIFFIITVAILHICKVMQSFTNTNANQFNSILCKFLHILYFAPTGAHALSLIIS